MRCQQKHVISLCHLIMEETSHHLCCILLVRNKSQVVPTLKVKGMHKGVSEVEITGGHLQSLCTTSSLLKSLEKGTSSPQSAIILGFHSPHESTIQRPALPLISPTSQIIAQIVPLLIIEIPSTPLWTQGLHSHQSNFSSQVIFSQIYMPISQEYRTYVKSFHTKTVNLVHKLLCHFCHFFVILSFFCHLSYLKSLFELKKIISTIFQVLTSMIVSLTVSLRLARH